MGHDLRMDMNGAAEPRQDLETWEDDSGEGRIRRRDTLIRIGLTLLFLLVIGVIETVLALIVTFELIVALVTERPPSPRVRELANRIVSFYYRIGRYLTYNESRVPFPFDEFPGAIEEDAWDPRDAESKAMGIAAAFEADEDPQEEELSSEEEPPAPRRDEARDA